jgi:hypothetical protein
MIVIPNLFAVGGRERDLTMRVGHHGRKRDHTGYVVLPHLLASPPSSEQPHTHRKVPLLRSFGSQVRDDNHLIKGSNREIHRSNM